MLETDGICEDVSDWGSDFDEDEVDDGATLKHAEAGDLYEVPDGKPAVPIPTVTGGTGQTPSPPGTITGLPNWLRKVEAVHNHAHQQNTLPPVDENSKPQAAVYIENVLLPTRATKDEDSKNFIETLKRKLSQKNLLVGTNGKICSLIPTTGPDSQNKPSNQNHKALQKQPDLNNSVDSEVLRKVKESIQKFPWFYRVDRTKAELILENYMVDGSFLVRECHHGGPNIPFTLTIRYGKRLFHIQIRIRPDNNFALGTAKMNEMHFSSVLDMIDTYKKTPLQLHTNGKFFGETKLTNPPIVYSFSK